MRLLKMLKTNQIEDNIRKYLMILEAVANRDFLITFNSNIKDKEGIYVFADEIGYHYVVSERGNEVTHKITDDIFEICYWAIKPFVSDISYQYELDNRENDINLLELDPRKVAFPKQIELWSLLGENFKKRREIEINEILEEYPYS